MPLKNSFYLQLLNMTLVTETEEIGRTQNVCGTDATTISVQPDDKVNIEAFFYIVVVLTFYATSIVLLLIKYARNDDEEVNLKYQYSEFVKRERFQTAQYKNMMALQKTKAVLNTTDGPDGVAASGLSCPVIIVSEINELRSGFGGSYDRGIARVEIVRCSSITSLPPNDQIGLHVTQSLNFDSLDITSAAANRKRCLSV